MPRDRIIGIIGVDQCGDVRRHRHRITRRDFFQTGKIGDRYEAVRDQFGGLAQSRDRLEIDTAHVAPEGGVHTT